MENLSFENPVFIDLLKTYSSQQLITLLSQFLNDARLARFQKVIDMRLFSLQIAFENPSNVHNALASLRTAEAFGINHMHIIGPECGEKSRQGRRTTKGCYRWSQLKYYSEPDEFFKPMQKNQFKFYGASLEATKELSELDFDKPVCLLFGNEIRGISEKAKTYCNEFYKIPMQGMVESFNLTVSCALSLYEASRKKRALLKTLGDFSEQRKERELAWYIVRSIGLEKSKKYLRGLIKPSEPGLGSSTL